eukprot:337440_1
MAYQQKLKQSSLKPRRIKTEHDANSDDHKEYEAPSQNNKEISTTMKPPHNQCEHVERSARTEAKQSNTENERQCYEAALKKSHANDMEHKLKQQIQTLKESLKQKDTQIASLREEMDLALQDEDDHKEYEVIKQYTEKINCKLTQTESEYNENMQQLRRQIESFTSKIEGYKMKIKRMKEYTETITEQCVRKQEEITQLKQLTEDSASYGKQTEYNELEASSMGATTHHLKPAHPDSDSDDESLNHQHDDDAKSEHTQTKSEYNENIVRPQIESFASKHEQSQQINAFTKDIERLKSALQKASDDSVQAKLILQQENKEMIQNIKKEHQGLLEKKNEECAQARVELNIKKQELEHAMQQVDEHTTSLRNAQMKQIQCTQMQQYIACEKADIHTLQQERQKLNEIIQQKDDKIDALRSTSEHAISLQKKSVEDKQCMKKQQQQIQTLKKKIKRVCGNMEIMQVSFDAKETQCAEMEQNIKLYTSNKLQQKAQKLNETIQTLTERFRSAQAQAKQWKAALSLQNGEKERLQHQIQQKEQDMQLQKAKANKLQQETQKRNETIETLTKRLRSAQTQAKQWKEASKLHNQEESRRFKQRKEDKERLQHQIRQKEERYTKDMQMKQDEIDTITTKLRAKESECAALRSSYEESKSHEEEMNQLEEERKQTQDQHNKDIDAKEEEIRRLESELEAKQRDLYQKEKEHQMLLDASQAEVNTLKEQLQSAQRETLEKTECNAELQEKLHENEKVIESLKAANATQREEKENEYAMSLKQAKDDGLNTQKELERVNTKYNELEKDQEALNTKHRQNQQRIEELMAKTKLLESKESEYHKEHAADTKQKDETIHDLRQENESSKSKIEDHKRDMDHKEKEHAEEIQNIKKALGKKDVDIESLRKQLLSSQTEAKQGKRENEQLIQALNNDRNQHKSYETEMKTQMEQKDESIQTLQKEKKSLEQRMEHKLDEALKGKGTRIASLKRLTKEMESLRQFISEN